MTEPATAFEVVWKQPDDCARRELELFEDTVLLGGEVIRDGLTGRIRNAERLVFCKAGGLLLGVAALKRPAEGYLALKAAKAKVDLDDKDWPLEFGWAFVCPSARGNQLPFRMLRCVLDGIDYGVFATSRKDNPRIHVALKAVDFVPTGESYNSDRGRGKMMLFLRPAKKPPQISEA